MLGSRIEKRQTPRARAPGDTSTSGSTLKDEIKESSSMLSVKKALSAPQAMSGFLTKAAPGSAYSSSR